MADQTFTPPKYKEITHVLFNKHTGAIVASEDHWMLLPETAAKQGTYMPDLQKPDTFRQFSHLPDLDVLHFDSSEIGSKQIKYVDLKLRKPITGEAQPSDLTGTNPQHIKTP
jgi:hypothetical protein